MIFLEWYSLLKACALPIATLSQIFRYMKNPRNTEFLRFVNSLMFFWYSFELTFWYPEKPINRGFMVAIVAYVLYAVGYSHIPRTTHRPIAFVYNIIPSTLIYPVHSIIHLDIHSVINHTKNNRPRSGKLRRLF